MNGATPMGCGGFVAWLDAGRPRAGSDGAAAHAAVCAACNARLEADREIESLLAADAPVAPDGFTERVMRAVDRAHAARAHAAAPAWSPGSALPWWARAALQPPALGAAALAALLAWRPEAFERAGRAGVTFTAAAGQSLGTELSRLLAPMGATFPPGPAVQFGLLGTAALLLALAAAPLFRWTERLALRGAAVRPRPSR